MVAFLAAALAVTLVVPAAQVGSRTSGHAAAQGATVAGVVRDGGSGTPIAGAAVSLRDLDRLVTTDSAGRYVLTDVPPGPQHLSVRSIGYATRTLHALVPAAGRLDINISLRAEPIRLAALGVRTATIAADGDAAASAGERSVSSPRWARDPMLSEPDVFRALSGAVNIEPEAPTGLHIFGGAADQTAYLLDGIPVFNPLHAAGVFSGWNADAIDRIDVAPPSSSAALLSPVLSGAVSAVVRSPGPRLGARGTLSTTQARVTVDGPLVGSQIGYLVSLRTGLPAAFAPDEPSYLGGEGGDALALIEAPLAGGRLRLIGYENENELDAAALVGANSLVVPAAGRNAFAWQGRSAGATWSGAYSGLTLRAQAWYADTHASGSWANTGEDIAAEPVGLRTGRRDIGALALAGFEHGAGLTLLGLRVERARTTYHVVVDSILELDAATPLVVGSIDHTHTVGSQGELSVGTALTLVNGSWNVGPRAHFLFALPARWSLGLYISRTHQFAQSLRNPESAVGAIFPAELYVAADEQGVPVATGNQARITGEYRVAPGFRMRAQLFARDFEGLVLTAPVTGEPFAAPDHGTGSGSATGLSLDGSWDGTRFTAIARWTWQRVRLEHTEREYVPGYGAAHVGELGVTFFPSATAMLRVGATVQAGRHATPIVGRFEWESCNLLDQGCEFAGSPRYEEGTIGELGLPAYVRLDAGVRKHWHLSIRGVDASVALFASVTNILGRANIWTYAIDPDTGDLQAIEMRPRAPLVIGLDWRF